MKIPDTTWDWIFLEVEKSLVHYNISEDKKKAITEGYTSIREILDDNFLTLPANTLRQSLLNNFAPWALIKNADFGNKLGLMKTRKYFRETKEDLLKNSFEHSFGAEAIVEVSGDFLKKALDVEFIKKISKSNAPDFRVKIDNNWIYFELTTFRTYSEEIKSINDFSYKLQTSVNEICQAHERFIEVDFNGMTIRNAEEHFNKVISKTQEMVQSQEEFEETFCGVNLKILGRDDGYGPPYIHGIRVMTDETNAISRKLSKKIKRKQLPAGESSVLLVFTRSPFLPDFKDLAERLTEVVNSDPDMGAAVIQCISHKQLDISLDRDKFEIIHRAEYDGIYNRYNIIIRTERASGITKFLESCL
jgi:hypothetical protein